MEVLIIEDSVVLALYMEDKLRRAGVKVVEIAATIEEAYEKIKLRRWDAILGDACLGTESVMDTHELYEWTITVHKGFLIATSAQEQNCAEQMQYCTHNGHGKEGACDLAIQLLLSETAPLAQAA